MRKPPLIPGHQIDQSWDIIHDWRLRLPIARVHRDFVDPTTAAMHAGVIVAFTEIAPIQDEHVSIGSGGQFHPAEPLITGKKEVFAMGSDVATPASQQVFTVRSPPMKIEGHQRPAQRRRPTRLLINHQPTVSVSAAEIIGGTIA